MGHVSVVHVCLPDGTSSDTTCNGVNKPPTKNGPDVVK